jgi:hypothetical protein
MRVKLVKNNLIHEYHLSETRLLSIYETVGEGVQEEVDVFDTQQHAVDHIYHWTSMKLKMGWEIA